MIDIKAAIIDDELPAARLLQNMVKKLRPQWDINIVPGSIVTAAKWFDEGMRPDIIFLDIQLSDGTSFQLINKLPQESMIVFTTAYDEYALRAFSLNSIDYLLKPIRSERLALAINKFERYREAGLLAELGKYINAATHAVTTSTPRYRERFLITTGRKLNTLAVDEIAYFRSEDKITIATTHSGRTHIVDPSLGALEQQLNPRLFFRANRQFIISAKAIRSIEQFFGGRWAIRVAPDYGENIIVSREKATSLKTWLNS